MGWSEPANMSFLSYDIRHILYLVLYGDIPFIPFWVISFLLHPLAYVLFDMVLEKKYMFANLAVVGTVDGFYWWKFYH